MQDRHPSVRERQRFSSGHETGVVAQGARACGRALTRGGRCLLLLSDTSGLCSLVPVKSTTDHLGFNTSRLALDQEIAPPSRKARSCGEPS